MVVFLRVLLWLFVVATTFVRFIGVDTLQDVLLPTTKPSTLEFTAHWFAAIIDEVQ